MKRNDIDHLATLANIPLSDDQKRELTNQVEITIQYVSKLQELDTTDAAETSQVTGLENVFREDEIDPTRILTQEEALSNATRTYNGYFVVNQILGE